MKIRKMNPRVNTFELCEIVKALESVSVCARKPMGDRFDDAVSSATALLIERIEAHYLPEKHKYEVVVKPNKVERVVIEAESIEEAKSNACDRVDDMLGGNHDGLLVVSCKEVD